MASRVKRTREKPQFRRSGERHRDGGGYDGFSVVEGHEGGAIMGGGVRPSVKGLRNGFF